MYLTSLLKDFKKSKLKITFKSAELREQKHSSESTLKLKGQGPRSRKIQVKDVPG